MDVLENVGLEAGVDVGWNDLEEDLQKRENCVAPRRPQSRSELKAENYIDFFKQELSLF